MDDRDLARNIARSLGPERAARFARAMVTGDVMRLEMDENYLIITIDNEQHARVHTFSLLRPPGRIRLSN